MLGTSDPTTTKPRPTWPFIAFSPQSLLTEASPQHIYNSIILILLIVMYTFSFQMKIIQT
jgi:hypothetical protein